MASFLPVALNLIIQSYAIVPLTSLPDKEPSGVSLLVSLSLSPFILTLSKDLRSPLSHLMFIKQMLPSRQCHCIYKTQDTSD